MARKKPVQRGLIGHFELDHGKVRRDLAVADSDEIAALAGCRFLAQRVLE
jgi:hypothetical protein